MSEGDWSVNLGGSQSALLKLQGIEGDIDKEANHRLGKQKCDLSIKVSSTVNMLEGAQKPK